MSWKGLDHGTIYEMVVNQGAGPEISRAAEDGWGRIQDVIVDVESDIRSAMRASEDGWEGSGADAMRAGYTPLGAWVLSAAADASRTATAVTEQAAMAANTRRLVADNPPPQNVGQHLHSFFGGLDGDSVYLDQAAAVDQLMTTYEKVSGDNQQRFDTWSVPPSIVVTPAAAGPSGPGGPGGGGVGGMPETGGLGPAGGSGIASALAPGGGAAVAGAGGAALPGGVGSPGAGGTTPGSAGTGGAMPGAVAPGGGAGVLPGAVAAPPGGGVTGGAPAAGSGGAGAGRTPGTAGGAAPVAPGSGPGALGTGAAGAGRPGAGGAGTATGGRGLGTGGVAHPSQRPLGSAGGSGTGPGPWSRAGTDAGRTPAGAAPIRPVAPAVPPRTSAPDWRSVLLPPEREPAASTRSPGETAARPAGPGAPGGSTATPGGAAAQGSGARGTGSPGMHAPMMGGGAGGAQPEGRRRASYLIDDSDAFVDRRWFTEPVITPDDPL